MKFFKKASVFAFVLIICLCLVGCGNPTTAKGVGTSANRHADRIMRVLNNLDTATDEDFDISDISPIANQTSTARIIPSKSYGNDYALSNTAIVKNKTLPKLVDYSYNDGVIKDKVYSTKKVNNNVITKSLAEADTIKLNDQKIRNYSYKPKYVNSTSESFSNQNLQNYFAKIEDLYNNCADCICSNAECNNSKQNLINACLNCKDLCAKLENGTIKLSDTQISECNDCLNQLNGCVDKLNKSKGELSNMIKLLKPLLKNYNTNFDSLLSCYCDLGICLDSRIDNLNECTDCINRLNNIICKNCNDCEIQNNQVLTTQNATKTTQNTNNQNSIIQTNKDNISYNARPLNTQKKTNNGGKKPSVFERIKSAMQNIKLPEKWRRNSTMQTKMIDYNIQSNNQQNVNPNIVNNQTNTTTLMPNNQQANNAVMNGQPFTSNNPAFSNGYYNAGMGYGRNGLYPFNRYNIDTYASTPRNIDTYQNIYTNIDTYKKDYLQNFESEQDIDVQPLDDGQKTNLDNNLNESEEKTLRENSTPIQPNCDFKQTTPQNDIKKMDNDNNLTTSPLPNPFDPQKVEQDKKNQSNNQEQSNIEPEINKENGEIIPNESYDLQTENNQNNTNVIEPNETEPNENNQSKNGLNIVNPNLAISDFNDNHNVDGGLRNDNLENSNENQAFNSDGQNFAIEPKNDLNVNHDNGLDENMQNNMVLNNDNQINDNAIQPDLSNTDLDNNQKKADESTNPNELKMNIDNAENNIVDNNLLNQNDENLNGNNDNLVMEDNLLNENIQTPNIQDENDNTQPNNDEMNNQNTENSFDDQTDETNDSKNNANLLENTEQDTQNENLDDDNSAKVILETDKQNIKANLTIEIENKQTDDESLVEPVETTDTAEN